MIILLNAVVVNALVETNVNLINAKIKSVQLLVSWIHHAIASAVQNAITTIATITMEPVIITMENLAVNAELDTLIPFV